jgi:nitrous oxidase accessory protein
MRVRQAAIVLVAALLFGGLPAVPHAQAETIEVAVGDGLIEAVAAAMPGDVLHLAPGKHKGPVVVEKALTIEGDSFETTTVEGNGQGSVIRILASGVTVRGLHISGSGTDKTGIDAGVYVEKGADNPVIERNWLDQNLFGITLHGPKGARAIDNKITNRNDLWLNERGNGIHAWNNIGATIAGNTVTGGRDGIFMQMGKDNVIAGNHFERLRFAVHYMYSKGGAVTDNVSIGDHIGYALMYSDNLKVSGNISVKDRDQGLMLNSAKKGQITDNYVYGSGGKCLFMYLALRNRVNNNRFENCDIGVHVTGSDDNAISDNAFIGNHVQMRYAGTKTYEWSVKGHGNYWSDNTAFDLDGDSIADTAYRPNNVVDWLVWRYPLSKLLLSSPAMELLRVAQGQFPALTPGGVVDSYPLMAPEAPPRALPPLPDNLEWEGGSADPDS